MPKLHPPMVTMMKKKECLSSSAIGRLRDVTLALRDATCQARGHPKSQPIPFQLNPLRLSPSQSRKALSVSRQ